MTPPTSDRIVTPSSKGTGGFANAAMGIDIQSLSDIRSSLDHSGRRYVQRVYDENEIAHFGAYPRTATAYLTTPFAAREAVLELPDVDDALEHWPDISIITACRSQKEARLSNGRWVRAEDRGIPTILACVDSVGDRAPAVDIADVIQNQ
jgi:phosphopantetheinyl transferase (holo-ACP synthase)